MAKVLSCLWKACRRDRKRRGIVAVEFALLAAPFFMLLMGTIELSLMIGAQQLLESVAFNVSRLAKTGYTDSGLSQAETVNQILVTELSSYGTLIDPSKVTMTQAAYGSFSGSSSGTGGTAGFGASNEIVVYTLTYSWKLFTPMMSSIIGTNGYFPLSSTIVVHNEPYG